MSSDPVRRLGDSPLSLSCLYAVAIGHRQLAVLLILVELFYVGFAGTEHVWYLRHFRGEGFEPRKVGALTGGFFGRFMRLGLICAIPILVPVLTWSIVEGSHHLHGRVRPLPFAMSLLLIGIAVVLDVGLTFVIPILAFSTDSAKDALKSGVKMIADTWPGSLRYVLAPGLAISFSSLLVSSHALGGWARPVLWVITGMVAFLLRGTAVPFYLRRHPQVGPSGSVQPRMEIGTLD